jgi:predicted Rossmann fold flavoprotein
VEEWDVVVVGAGAAGLLASIRIAELGRGVLLLEKNRKAGVKILISGGTRCNLTHDTDPIGIRGGFERSAGRFLQQAFGGLTPEELIELFRLEGLETKVESTGKVFPTSDRALDVLNALLARLRRTSCELALGEPVENLQVESGDSDKEQGIMLTTPKRTIRAKRVVVTTGGKSFPGCGTTGDGWLWARELGHTIIPTFPALVPLETSADWVKRLQGVTLPDVSMAVTDMVTGTTKKRKALLATRNSLLFTHFGLSGPGAMDLSRVITPQLGIVEHFVQCDFLPDESLEQFDQWLELECRSAGGRTTLAVLATRIPRRLAESILELSSIPLERRLAELTRAGRQDIVRHTKRNIIPITGTLGFKKAEVTRGGIALAEVDPRTMESRLVKNLFFAGEVLDVDGRIGGYNFQAAFSTGWLAGEHAARQD